MLPLKSVCALPGSAKEAGSGGYLYVNPAVPHQSSPLWKTLIIRQKHLIYIKMLIHLLLSRVRMRSRQCVCLPACLPACLSVGSLCMSVWVILFTVKASYKNSNKQYDGSQQRPPQGQSEIVDTARYGTIYKCGGFWAGHFRKTLIHFSRPMFH